MSIMLANNEIGKILPIPVIGQLLKNVDIFFRVDAVQTVGYIPIDVNNCKLTSC